MPINSFLYPAPSTPSFAYEVANSLRLDEPSNSGLTKTPSGAGNRRTFTLSTWVKRAKITNETGDVQTMFESRESNNDNCALTFQTNDTLSIKLKVSGTNKSLITNRVFRDVSAWYHIVCAVDTTQSTASNRVKIYVNGVQETSFGTEDYPAQDAQTSFNNSVGHGIGKRSDTTSQNFDGYLTEVVMIDGSALAPTSFGEFDSDSPTIWKPIDISGLTFGTNGFYLDFEDSSALGNDVSGNNNDYSVSNLSAVDQSIDTCTNNFATWNPLNVNDNMGTFSNGNLEYDTSGNSFRTAFATFGADQGKWYFECKRVTGTSFSIGIISLDYKNRTKNVSYIGGAGDATNNIGYLKDGNISIGGSESSGYASYGNGETVMVAMDLDNGKVYFGVDGTWGNSGDPTSGSSGTGAVSFTPSSETWTFAVSVYNSHWEANFGAPMYSISSGNADANGYGNFEYSVPSGYYALNSKNLAEYG